MTTCPPCNQTDCRDFPLCYEALQKQFQAEQSEEDTALSHYGLTKSLGIFGDRLLGIGIK